MPNFRKLEPTEVQTLNNKGKGERALIAEQYDAILADYEVGEYGEAVLDVGDVRLSVRNRLRAAAIRRGFDVTFRRSSGEYVRFQIVEHSNGKDAALVEPPSVVSSEPPAKKKVGRPRKNA